MFRYDMFRYDMFRWDMPLVRASWLYWALAHTPRASKDHGEIACGISRSHSLTALSVSCSKVLYSVDYT